MKLLPSFLVLFLTLWSLSGIEGHAWWEPFTSGLSSCSSVGFFVNNYDCSKFYRCVNYEFDKTGGSGGWVPPTKGWSPPMVGWSPFKRSVSSDESIRSKRSEKGWARPTKPHGWAAPTGWSRRNLLVRYDFDCPCGLVFDESVSVCVNPGHGGCAGGWSSASSPPKFSCMPSPSKGWSHPKGSYYNKGGWAQPANVVVSGWNPSKSGFGGVLQRSVRPNVEVLHLVKDDRRSFSPASSYEIIYEDRYIR